MKKLTNIATALADNTLSVRAMTLVKGGIDNQSGSQTQSGSNGTNVAADDKRRERPGGGITTN